MQPKNHKYLPGRPYNRSCQKRTEIPHRNNRFRYHRRTKRSDRPDQQKSSRNRNHKRQHRNKFTEKLLTFRRKVNDKDYRNYGSRIVHGNHRYAKKRRINLGLKHRSLKQGIQRFPAGRQRAVLYRRIAHNRADHKTDHRL